MINRFKWLEVKPETRRNIVIYLSDITGFPPVVRTGTVEVAGNKVVCDGFTDQDLCAITPELLKAALGESTLGDIDTNDIYAMFYELVRRLELPPTPIELPKEFIGEPISVLEATSVLTAEIIKKPFCEFCDSKGHFHKKDCKRTILPQDIISN